MINTSEEYKQAMEKNSACIEKADILLKNGTLLHVERKNIKGGIKIDDSVSDAGKFEIGSAITNKLNLSLNNMYDEFTEYDFTDAIVTTWIGKMLETGIEWLKKGVFNAVDPTNTTGIITLECLDNMSKFNKAYDGKLSFPATLQRIVQHCCTICGVLLADSYFPNYSYTIQKNPFDSGITYRAMIAYCAMLAGCYARCNTDGKLELKWYDTGAFTENGKHLEINKFSSLNVATEEVVITGIRVTAADGSEEDQKGETYLAGTEGYVLSIKGNPLVEYGMAKTAASLLAERIVGMRFSPMNASCIGDPSWEAGDAAVLTDRKGRHYNCYLTNVTYAVGEYATISCDAEPAARHSADRYKEIEKIIADIKKDTRHQLSSYGKHMEIMNSLAINAMGYYETVEIQDDGSRITYMHDKPSMEDSTVIYKKSIDGFFWSKDGGETWTGGIDKDGNAVMNVIAAIGLQADWINTGRLQVSDDDGNAIFLVDMDTKQVMMSGNHIMIGGNTATDLIDIANKNASEALEEVQKAKSLQLHLSNEYQGIPTDYRGNYTTFPECLTTVQVTFGSLDITEDAVITATASAAIEGKWDAATNTYTVLGLFADSGWVDFKAVYLTMSVVKRFNVVKQKAGVDGEDSILLQIESSNGNIFKNTGIATTLTVSIIAGNEIIDSSGKMYDYFGTSATLEWKSKKNGETEFSPISPDDIRISDAGFIFTLHPNDVREKNIFRCTLNY